MNKDKILKITKILLPILLIVIAAVITICINLASTVYPAKYYSKDGYIDFSANNTYATANNTGLYNYDEDNRVVVLDDNAELERQSVYTLISADGKKYISASAITWQVIGGLFYVGACVYMCIVYKAN